MTFYFIVALELCKRKTSYQVILSKLKEAGVVLDADSGKNCGHGEQSWEVHLSNTTVTVYLPLNHHYASLQLFDETYPSLLKEWAEIERECVKYRMVKDSC